MAIREINLGPRSRVVEQGTGAVRDGAEPPVAREAPALPERAGREGDQPLPTPGKRDVLAELAAVMPPALAARRAIGIRRYGTPLQTWNGRDVHQDLDDELLDALAYARQAKLERRDLERDLAEARLQRSRAEAESAALRHNLEQARSDLSAEQAAVAQLQAELVALQGR